MYQAIDVLRNRLNILMDAWVPQAKSLLSLCNNFVGKFIDPEVRAAFADATSRLADKLRQKIDYTHPSAVAIYMSQVIETVFPFFERYSLGINLGATNHPSFAYQRLKLFVDDLLTAGERATVYPAISAGGDQ